MIHQSGIMIAWKDAGIVINVSEVAGVIVRAGDEKGSVLCGTHEGLPMALEASKRDWQATLGAIQGMGGAVVPLPLYDSAAETDDGTIHVVVAHLTVIGQVPEETARSRVSLTSGTHFEVRATGQQIVQSIRAAVEKMAKVIAASVAPAQGGIQ